MLVSPDGVTYDKSANDPTADLVGQVLYDTVIENISQGDVGGSIVIQQPSVSIRRTSLTRVPVAGEKWEVKVPDKPLYAAPKESYIMERAPEDGRSIGFINLFITKAQQS